MKANPELIPGLVDEAIRWMTPAEQFHAVGDSNTELADAKLQRAIG